MPKRYNHNIVFPHLRLNFPYKFKTYLNSNRYTLQKLLKIGNIAFVFHSILCTLWRQLPKQ